MLHKARYMMMGLRASAYRTKDRVRVEVNGLTTDAHCPNRHRAGEGPDLPRVEASFPEEGIFKLGSEDELALVRYQGRCM